ncbi:uncharacterized protein MONBRDRAFT_23665 [Monosiga brevicollis MX1]|uniref:RFX1-4/6/8-like BCD domain-containing protein n=1 Tax=Monosiga brevicollis TaxID=81824 RepID=A9UU40_MONBE|nr:uncharacterized protein MONBRDRAFT_23665 [Monosiga brevicollis MX1]EDQ91601.1 predicted protein [Monosiga brevicollis MX1]|eukprot:XP_001744023.1 hypothetical protein [Monosiga brevicollis MX1]
MVPKKRHRISQAKEEAGKVACLLEDKWAGTKTKLGVVEDDEDNKSVSNSSSHNPAQSSNNNGKNNNKAPVTTSKEGLSKTSAGTEATPSTSGKPGTEGEPQAKHTPSIDTLEMLAQSLDQNLEIPELPYLAFEDVREDAEDTPELADVTAEMVGEFAESYRSHCETLLSNLKEMNFAQLYANIHSFWTKGPEAHRTLAHSAAVCIKVELWDTILYDTMLHVLVPEVLRPVGKNAISTIHTLVDDLISSLKDLKTLAVKLPWSLIEAKQTAGEVLEQIVRRRLALNELAQAGSKMLSSQSQVHRMRLDLERVSTDAIRRESAWVTGCEDSFVEQIFAELKALLEQPRGLSYTSHWLMSVVERVFSNAEQRFEDSSVGDDDGESTTGSNGKPAAGRADLAAPRSPPHDKAELNGAGSAAAGPEATPTFKKAGHGLDALVEAATKDTLTGQRSASPARDKDTEHVTSKDESSADAMADADAASTTAGEDDEARAVRKVQLNHKVSRNLLQSWSFYSVQILRELTMKSAPSFGSFNALRMLLDEYLFYIVQTRVTHPCKVFHHPDVIIKAGAMASTERRPQDAQSETWSSANSTRLQNTTLPLMGLQGRGGSSVWGQSTAV